MQEENQQEKQAQQIKSEVKEKMLSYILAAFGLVAGLAWNEAIKSLVETFFPSQQGNLWAKFIYAIFITVLVVIFSLYLSKIIKTKKEN